MPPAPERRRARVLRGQEADAAGRAAMGLTGLESPDGFHGMIDAKLVERVMTQAREAGFQTGYAEGITQAQAAADAARAEAERRIARACAAVGAAAGELATRETASVEAVEDEVAAIAFELARAILGRELEVATAPGAAAVARALSLAPPRQPVTVRLHPDDLAVLGDPAALAPGREVIAVPDPSVTPGGCLVESGGALIDARVEPALERVRQAMLG